jgi:hypothetical protein
MPRGCPCGTYSIYVTNRIRGKVGNTPRELLTMFVTFVLSILLIAYSDGHALPVYCTPSPSSNASALSWENGILAAINSTNSKTQAPRTLFSITWSCILTVFICAWTSVHPNLPPPGRMGGLMARMRLVFWTIVAPELVLAWAVRQWFAAREIRNIYNWHMGKWRVWS